MQDIFIVTIGEFSTGNIVLKNVKIDAETHRQLSIAASTMAVQKSVLCSALVRAALKNVPENVTLEWINSVTSDVKKTADTTPD